MTLHIDLSGRSSLTFEPVAAKADKGPMVLMTLEGRLHGDALNCALIPVAKMPELLETMRLAARLAQP